jgi:hypothetical protein
MEYHHATEILSATSAALQKEIERGGIRGYEAVAGEAGGLPLDLETTSRSAAPVASLFPPDRTKL